jgi:hypothetical protein
MASGSTVVFERLDGGVEEGTRRYGVWDHVELWDAPELKAHYDYRTEYPPEGQGGLRVVL